MLYAVYIVMLKRKVDREEKLDIPMFFGEWTMQTCDANVLVQIHDSYHIVLYVCVCRVCGLV